MLKPLLTISLLCLLNTVSAQVSAIPIGRTATPAEIKAWDIDVRADLKGLPAGRGTVSQGQELWDTQCASCHGVFGEANEVFPPLIGGTTQQDILDDRDARLLSAPQASRHT